MLLLLTGLLVALAAIGGVLLRHRRTATGPLADRDPVTGLGTREQLSREATTELHGATEERPVTLVVLDVEGFRGINDLLGHDAGDRLLRLLAERVARTAGKAATTVRLGGDRFALLLPRTTAGRAAELAERIRAAAREPMIIDGLTLEIGLRAGTATAPPHGTSLSTLLHHAGIANHRARRVGAVVGYDPAATTEHPGDLQAILLPELHEALHEGRLELHYQPIFGTDGEVRDLEALLRWNHPQHGLLTASDFLPAIRQTSLVRPLTEWMLRTATAEAAAWRADGHGVRLVVNLAAQSLLDDALPKSIIGIAAAAGLPRAALSIEFREAAVVTDPPRVAAALTRLAEAGIAVDLDNVGAGAGHWHTMARAPLGRLKLDRELVRLLPESLAADRIVAGLVGIAEDLGLDSIAVGVESREAARRLIELGVDGLQGYALCRPMPAAAVAPWLSAWREARTAKERADLTA